MSVAVTTTGVGVADNASGVGVIEGAGLVVGGGTTAVGVVTVAGVSRGVCVGGRRSTRTTARVAVGGTAIAVGGATAAWVAVAVGRPRTGIGLVGGDESRTSSSRRMAIAAARKRAEVNARRP